MGHSSLKIGLALSGGGAKGFSHIAVIKKLEELGISPSYIAGTSMGALIGGWYAAGKDFRILEDIARKKQWKKFLSIREILSSARLDGGLFTLHEFEKFLDEHLGSIRIENLKISYCAIATSLKTGKEVRLNSGILKEAILASSCIPILFVPINKDNDFLVDGGIVNNFPIDVCFEMGADIVIGVDVRYLPDDFEYEASKDRSLFHWKIFKVLNYLMEVMHKKQEQELTEKSILIKPYISHISIFDFERIDEILKLGEEAFLEKENEIRQKLGLPPKKGNFFQKLFEQ